LNCFVKLAEEKREDAINGEATPCLQGRK